jgi:hypothetical protein
MLVRSAGVEPASLTHPPAKTGWDTGTGAQARRGYQFRHERVALALKGPLGSKIPGRPREGGLGFLLCVGRLVGQPY